MRIDTLIFTTASTDWMAQSFALIRATLSQAKGIEVGDIDIKHITLDTIPTVTDSDGDVKPDWAWFKREFTDKAKGYNAVCLHISGHERAVNRITPKGTYNRDPDEIFEFWVCADKGEKARHYNMSEFARVYIHEQGHGFERFVYGPKVNLVHTYDYDLKQLPEVHKLMDFTEWNKLQAERDRLLGVKVSLLQRLLAKLTSAASVQTPIASRYWALVSQPFGAQSVHYLSGIHCGTDFLCPTGTPVYAPQDGIIIQTFSGHKSMGNAVYYSFVKDTVRYYCAFLHLQSVKAVGSYKRGEIVGYTGNTGDSSGPHLHLEVWKVIPDRSLLSTSAGVRENLIDPIAFFKSK